MKEVRLVSLFAATAEKKPGNSSNVKLLTTTGQLVQRVELH